MLTKGRPLKNDRKGKIRNASYRSLTSSVELGLPSSLFGLLNKSRPAGRPAEVSASWSWAVFCKSIYLSIYLTVTVSRTLPTAVAICPLRVCTNAYFANLRPFQLLWMSRRSGLSGAEWDWGGNGTHRDDTSQTEQCSDSVWFTRVSSNEKVTLFYLSQKRLVKRMKNSGNGEAGRKEGSDRARAATERSSHWCHIDQENYGVQYIRA